MPLISCRRLRDFVLKGAAFASEEFIILANLGNEPSLNEFLQLRLHPSTNRGQVIRGLFDQKTGDIIERARDVGEFTDQEKHLCRPPGQGSGTRNVRVNASEFAPHIRGHFAAEGEIIIDLIERNNFPNGLVQVVPATGAKDVLRDREERSSGTGELFAAPASAAEALDDLWHQMHLIREERVKRLEAFLTAFGKLLIDLGELAEVTEHPGVFVVNAGHIGGPG